MIQENIKLGPIDLALPGAMELSLGMYGDRVKEVVAAFGFLKRDILESCMGAPYAQAQLKFGRIDPENGMILDRIF
jgi:NADH:ubiquinone oxidoreductase subunit D